MNDNVRIGYACLNSDISQGFKTCRFNRLTTDKWIELIDWNLKTLELMIDYTIEHHIGLLRISSDLIPFATKAKQGVELDWKTYFASIFAKISQKIQAHALRISMHPGQYTVLNSLDDEVVNRAVLDLEYHAELLELLGGTPVNKMIIHIGGVYGDKVAAMERFINQANQLSSKVRDHLVIENDERLYSIEEVLYISEQTDLPVIFDNLHHQVRQPDNLNPMTMYIQQAGKMWGSLDGRQKIHYSQQAPGKRPGAHSKTIAIDPFIEFLHQLPDYPIDIMLEVKDKNRSAEKIQVYLDKDISTAESLWAQRKYSVLAKSAGLYQRIRELLKDKKHIDYKHFIQLIEESESLPENIGGEVNAGQHIWGYFSKHATDKERESYLKYIGRYQLGELTTRQFRQFFKRLLKKYSNDYLARSLYFNE